MAISPFCVDRLCAGERLGNGATGLNCLTQGGLVFFELDDQMSVGDGGGFKRFFDNALRRT
jgi:hypothetical protein